MQMKHHPSSKKPPRLRTGFYIIGLFFALALSSLAGWAVDSPATGFSIASTPFDRWQTLPAEPLLSADGLSMSGGAFPPVVLLVDPNPPRDRPNISAPSYLTQPETATATFQFTYIPAGETDLWGEPCYEYPQAARAAVERAGVIWGNIIQSPVPITVRLCWINTDGRFLGYSGGQPLRRDFVNAPRSNTWFQGSLANSLAESDLDPNAFDMHIAMNGNFSWYLGLDANPPSDQFDFVTVMLHEIAHGLNFAGSMQTGSGQAQWGYGTGYPNIYDVAMYDGSGNQLIDASVFPNPSASLFSAVTSENLWFHGSNAMAANSGQRVKMYAPPTWMPGSSYSHLDFETFRGGPNRLMVYAISPGDAVHQPGPITIGLFQDWGWPINSGTTYTLNVNSTGASGVAITANPPAYSGTTDYSVSVQPSSLDVQQWVERLAQIEHPQEPANVVEQRHQALLEKAINNGTVPVIVRLKLTLLPEASLDVSQIQQQRSELSQLQERVLNRLTATRSRSLGQLGVKRFTLTPGFAIWADEQMLRELLADQDVLNLVEDELSAPGLSESIPLIGGDQHGAFDGQTGQGWVVAVLDTGVEKTHPFLTGKVVSEACYSTTSSTYATSSLCPGGAASSTAPGSGADCASSIHGCGHGTHVAGIAAGRGTSFSGVAKDADIIAIQVFSRFDSTDYCGSSAPCALAFDSDIVLGLERVFALRSSYQIAAANMSLGGRRYYSYCDTDSSKPAIDQLRTAGIATVIASGNSGYTDSLGAPACISTAISVGSTTKSDGVSGFSNSASFLDLLAPGSDINSSVLNGQYARYNGTSMAAPHVAGAWAVLKQAKPSATVAEIRDALVNTGRSITDSRTGAQSRVKPRIQVDQAVATLLDQPLDVTLTAPASVGNATFSSWSGCGSTSGTGNRSCTVSMTQNRTVTATYSSGGCEEHIQLDNLTVTDTRSYTACRTLTATRFTAQSPAQVTFRAGERITLGTGFRVDSGARFTAQIDSSLKPAPSRAATPFSHRTLTVPAPAPAPLWPSSRALTWSDLPESLTTWLTDHDASIQDAQASADGQFIVFATDAALLAEDDNAHGDVYGYDSTTGQLSLISRTADGRAGDAASHSPRLNAAGERVLYLSRASDLVAGPSNGYQHVYRYDPLLEQTVRLSVTATGAPASGDSDQLLIAGDWAIYRTEAEDIGPEGAGIYRDHLDAPQHSLVGRDLWQRPDPRASQPTASADGTLLAYQRPNASEREQIHLSDLFRIDAIGQTEASQHGLPTLSADGRYLTYRERTDAGALWLRVVDRLEDREALLPWPDPDMEQAAQFRRDGTELWWINPSQGLDHPEVLYRLENPLRQ